MPFIHIRSLPLASGKDVAAAVSAIGAEFAQATGVALEHVTVTWDYLRPGHYAAGGEIATDQPQFSHPVLVDLLAPDFNSEAEIASMLRVAAASVGRHAGVAADNVFLCYHAARSGRIFDQGRIVRW